ncbi:hypothetical protein F945_00724 [Acinetobacter rudis CIP 110305]|uniref:SnoaL-like domain-containing protein n=2 Tax=Acinetobacter rudis TaxID=632955 RepID=S3PLZ8_9GAMM|nr:hypothetical protein F945_00724 [Acinetobacter rudis CIP 110305]
MIEGDQEIATEVIDQIALWDKAIIRQQIDTVIEYCSEKVSLFDVSSQITGIREYRQEWEKLSPYFSQYIDIIRSDIKIHTATDLAVMHCLTKVVDVSTDTTLVPWCRTTLCMQKEQQRWLVVHQHISIPINMQTGNIILIKDKPKLRLVV